jgi:hypothetical protein
LEALEIFSAESRAVSKRVGTPTASIEQALGRMTKFEARNSIQFRMTRSKNARVLVPAAEIFLLP